MTRQIVQRGSALALAGVVVVAGSAFVAGHDPRLQQTEPAAAVAAPVAPAITPPVIEEPVVAIPDAAAEEVTALVKIDEAERARLANEMSRWVTRDPHKLVDVIADLAERQPLPLPPTFLLSIAWSETRGKILAVSPAGAAGLAQATPGAYLSEGLGGKVFVTNDYLMGTRAFIMKKPLGDALTIAAPLLKKNTPATRKRAEKLLAEAIRLRQEGMEELEALRPVANETFFRRIAEGDAYNLATLHELEKLIERGAPRAEMKRFHTRVQRDYTYLRNLQRTGWAKYERTLTAQRDTLLRKRFGQSPAVVIREHPYEAGEYLGETLDARFSPKQMAEFLAAHLTTKQQQARDLGVAEENLAAWTAALYNGGAVNVKRMQAGLIGALRETEKYMEAVPKRTAQLERVLG
jgi:soluble lytic murein transglycosylase-like protein